MFNLFGIKEAIEKKEAEKEEMISDLIEKYRYNNFVIADAPRDSLFDNFDRYNKKELKLLKKYENAIKHEAKMEQDELDKLVEEMFKQSPQLKDPSKIARTIRIELTEEDCNKIKLAKENIELEHGISVDSKEIVSKAVELYIKFELGLIDQYKGADEEKISMTRNRIIEKFKENEGREPEEHEITFLMPIDYCYREDKLDGLKKQMNDLLDGK